MSSSEDEVLSEVHIVLKPPKTKDKKNYISRFPINFPKPKKPNKTKQRQTNKEKNKKTQQSRDEQGDLELPRKKTKKRSKTTSTPTLTIVHKLETPLAMVGFQVWRGALILADYLLHKEKTFQDCFALELGAGSGFAGLVMSMVAKRCFITDFDLEILENCSRNAQLNSHLFRCPDCPKIRKLDWLSRNDLEIFRDPSQYKRESFVNNSNENHDFGWNEDDLKELGHVTVVLAADVIYDFGLTDAFLELLRLIFLGPVLRKCFLSVEKRINFTIEDLESSAPYYDYFFKRLREHGCFVAMKVEIDFHQFFGYCRIPELEVWEIVSSINVSHM